MAETGDESDTSLVVVALDCSTTELALRKSFVRRRFLMSPMSLHCARNLCAAATTAGFPDEVDEALSVETCCREW